MRSLANKFRQTVPEIVSVALRSFDPALSDRNGSAQVLPSVAARRRVVVLLTRTQYYFLTDTDISTALYELLERDVVR